MPKGNFGGIFITMKENRKKSETKAKQKLLVALKKMYERNERKKRTV